MSAVSSQEGLPTGAEKTKAISQYLDLQSILKQLATQVKTKAPVTQALFDQISTNVGGIGEYFSKSIDTVHYNELREKDSTAATKVFNVPELCEMILLNSSFLDIVHMTMTCHSLREIVFKSPKLMDRLLFKTVDPTSDPEQFQSPFKFPPEDDLLVKYDFEGLAIFLHYSETDTKQTWTIMFMHCDDSHPGISKVGSVWKDIRVIPPGFELRMPALFCESHSSSEAEKIKTKGQGLTLGELHEEAVKAMEIGCGGRLGECRGKGVDGALFNVTAS